MRLLRSIRKIPHSNKFSFYPEKNRKSNVRIFGENILWFLKNKEVNNFYYVYGLDVKGQNPNDFEAYTKIMKLRDNRNRAFKDFDYLGLLRDKFVFGQYMKSINKPTPVNYVLGNSTSITELNVLPQGEVKAFCKDLTGFGGADVFPVTLREGKVYVEGAEKDLSWLQSRMNDQFIIQEKISQEKELNKMYAGAINTIRILTANNGGKVRIVSAIMRIGANGSSTDNWASGGVIVKVNMENGKLEKYGYFKNVSKGKVTAHPDSGIPFEGFQIPFYKESCELVLDLHRYFYGIHSIGWDVAITPDGPTILEGNDNWDIAMQQKFYKKEIIEMLTQ